MAKGSGKATFVFRFFSRAKGNRPATGPTSSHAPGAGEYTRTITTTSGHRVRLRPISLSDGADWSRLRLSNKEILEPVEPTVAVTWEEDHAPKRWRGVFFQLNTLALSGAVVPLVIEVDGAFAGQVTIGGIQRGCIDEGWIGYWVDHTLSGRGIGTVACALGVDHGFDRVGLHRMTATTLPSNHASTAILKKVGFREEGYLRGNIHVGGRWQDHYLFGLLADDYQETAIARLRQQGLVF